MPIRNPVDYYPAMENHGPVLAYKHAIEALHADPQVDSMIVHLFAGFGIWSLDMKEILSNIEKPRKPILFWLIGPEKRREPTRLTLEEECWPTFFEIHRTVKVMASLFEHAKRRSKPLEISQIDFPLPPSLKELARHPDNQKTTILDEYESKKWFEALGLKVVQEVLIKDIDGAIKAAEEIGYPAVLKGKVEGQVHKTEAGLVKLNLLNADQFKSAYQEMRNLRIRPTTFLVQPMLKGDLELIVGIMRDPQFGPAAMVGLGGGWVEIYKDVAFRLVPLDQEEILNMVSDLKGKVLLNGYRGSEPVNMDRLADWLIRLGWLAITFDQIQEIDVNPLMIVNGEPVAVDAPIILKSDFHS
jgi:acyl-CoA synthetase (NDP forming)